MSRLLLRQISRDRSPKDIPVERAIALQAEPGATYQLLDARSRKPASGVAL